MSETEVGYWQAIVDDQRVSNERLSEALADARTEITRLREIVAAAAVYVTHLANNADGNEITTAFNQLHAKVTTYLEMKTQ
jgi:hypothetical protein